MFALWYLSFAIDEFRKYMGWTSIFDMFKWNNKNENKAITTGSNDSSLNIEQPKVPEPSTPSPKVPETVRKIEEKPLPKQAEPELKPQTKLIQKPQVPEEQPILKPIVTPTPFTTPTPISPAQVTPTSPASPKPASPASSTPTPPMTPTRISPPKPVEPKAESPKPTSPEPKPFTIPKSPEPKSPSPKPESPRRFSPSPLNTSDGENASTVKNKMPPALNDNSEPAWMSARPETRKSNVINPPEAFTNGGSRFESNFVNPKQTIINATASFLEEEGSKLKLRQNERRNKSDTMVDAAILEKLEAGFAKLQASDSKSLLKKYLTKEVFDNLKNKKTPTFGSTLLDCIQSGIENLDSGVGIYAPDAEAYSVFSELFDPIIEDYHKGFKKTDKHPPKDFGDVNAFANLDPNNEFVVSTRVRCGRSMEGYPFNPCLSEAQYKEMEEKVSSTLSGLEGELKGKFYPLTGMEKAVQQQLIDDHFLFKEGDRFLQAANACRFWPSGRGIYHNDNKTFLVWCNEEDHLRIISMQKGGDLGEIYRRLVTAVNDIEKRIPFSHHDRLGFLTFCPTNLGTTIRASVHIALPKLAADKKKLEEIAGKYNLQVRGTRGEHTEAEGGVYDISNKRRMGLTEFQAVKEMYDGIAELIKIEKSM